MRAKHNRHIENTFDSTANIGPSKPPELYIGLRYIVEGGNVMVKLYRNYGAPRSCIPSREDLLTHSHLGSRLQFACLALWVRYEIIYE